ncbi:MAG: hypothetical protein AAFU73_15675 [Planctomycetota bacterium]
MGGGSAKNMKARAGVLVALALFALVLRAVPILWGTAYIDDALFGFHPDEPKLVRFADRFPESITSNTDYRYPLFAHSVLGVVWQLALLVHPLEPDALPVPGEPRFEAATVFARGVYVLLFGGASMWLLARLAALLGIVSALPWILAAFSMQPFVVANTALAQTDLPMAVMLLGLIVRCVHVEVRERYRAGVEPAILGALLGATVAAKYTGLIGGLPVLVAVLIGSQKRRGGPTLIARELLVVGLGASAAFLAFVPGAVLDWTSFSASLAYEFTSKTQLSTFDAGRFASSLTTTLPVWGILLAAAGLALCPSARRNRVIQSSLVMFAIYLVVVRRALAPDWVMPLMPLVTVFWGVALNRIAGSWSTRGMAAAVILVVAGWTLSVRAVVGRYTQDTRYRCAAWIEANVESPGPIGEAPSPTARRSFASVRLPSGYEATDVFSRPQWIVMCERDYSPVQRVHENPRAFERFGVVFDPEAMVLSALGPVEIGFYRDILAASDEINWTAPQGHIPLYSYSLAKVFDPSGLPLDMDGVEIRVYRRNE